MFWAYPLHVYSVLVQFLCVRFGEIPIWSAWACTFILGFSAQKFGHLDALKHTQICCKVNAFRLISKVLALFFLQIDGKEALFVVCGCHWNLLYSADMSASFKGRVEKFLHNLPCGVCADKTSRHDEHVRIVVLSCKMSNLGHPH